MTPEPRSLRQRIREFFFAEEVPYGMAVVRMLLPWALMLAMAPRWQHAREMFSSDGASTPLWITYGYPSLFGMPIPAGFVAVALASVLIVSLVTMSLGWCTRASCWLVFTTYTYLNLLDSIGTITKYSVIACHGLLLLCLSQCGAVWSIDAWLKRRRRRRALFPGDALAVVPTSPAWPRRLLQFMVGFVYFGAAMTKLHTPDFFSGHQLQGWMVTNVNNANPLGEQLAILPALLILVAYITVVWEMTFIFLAWRGFGRVSMIAIGVMFHVATRYTLGLVVFPAVCCALYLAFLNERDVRTIAARWRRWKRRTLNWHRKRKPLVATPAKGKSPVPSFAVFAMVIAGTAVGGVGIEHALDPYGERRPEGRYTLKELDKTFVETQMLGPRKPLRDMDKVFDMQAGTFVLGGCLANPKKEFRHGEIMLVQATLSPPHEDMFLECRIHDGNETVVDRVAVLATHSMLRTNFYFRLTESLPAGEYKLVLTNAGREVMRRSIAVRERTDAVSAN